MKKILLLACVAAIAAFGINVATASAATCSPGTTSPYWTGELTFQAYVQNCSYDVDKVEFSSAINTGNNGMYDTTWGTYQSSNQSVGGVYAINLYQQSAGYGYYSIPAYCGGQVHSVWPFFNFRIHNTTGSGSWGPWHLAMPTVYLINC